MAKALPGAVSSCIFALCQTDVEAKCASEVQLAAGYTTRIQTLVPVASFTAPKDWNFAVLGVFATSDVDGEWEGGRDSGVAAPLGWVQEEVQLLSGMQRNPINVIIYGS